MKKTFIGAVALFFGLVLFTVVYSSYYVLIGFVSMLIGAFILVKEYFKD